MCENGVREPRGATMRRQSASRRIVRTFWNVEIKEKGERTNDEDNPGMQREREGGRMEGRKQLKLAAKIAKERDENQQP